MAVIRCLNELNFLMYTGVGEVSGICVQLESFCCFFFLSKKAVQGKVVKNMELLKVVGLLQTQTALFVVNVQESN